MDEEQLHNTVNFSSFIKLLNQRLLLGIGIQGFIKCFNVGGSCYFILGEVVGHGQPELLHLNT